jgi:N-acetylmuramoyl-L-alanine amidase
MKTKGGNPVTAIYLSPSVQEHRQFIIGGSEEEYMNRIADAMMPYLRACGISFFRNSPGSTLSQIVARSNAGEYDLHLALHTSSSPENMKGVFQGPDVYYFTLSPEGQRAADNVTSNLKKIYPDPNLVTLIPSTTMAELRRTKAPAILASIAYRDNYSDAAWIRDNIDEIGKNLVQSTAQYLGVPFVAP